MGSKLSKAVERHHGRDDAALPHAPSTSHDKLHPTHISCQENIQSPLTGGSLSGSVALSPLTSSIHTLPPASHVDNESEPMDLVQPTDDSTESHSSAISSEPQGPSGQVANDKLPPAKTCLICTEEFDHQSKAIKPCRCENYYCASCLRDLFLAACKDTTLMPPRCCTMIPIHHVRPHLSKDEAALFRAKFEEWNTAKPFYCPVPRCSAFIPDRLLPLPRTNSKGKQRVDSGIGIPILPTLSCPSCDTKLCINCRSLEHTGKACEPLEFGIDKKTARFLRKWGYKNCPKCGNGIRRMFGCNHMACRCGLHFCWSCLCRYEDCVGSCGDDDSDDGDSEPDSDDYDSDKEENSQVSLSLNGSESGQAQVGTTDSERSPGRTRNLDGGSANYWEGEDYDFGDEPTDDYQDRSWDCSHYFNPEKMSLVDSLRVHSSEHKMECMNCWCAVYPEIEMPKVASRGKPNKNQKLSRGRAPPRIRHFGRSPTQTLHPLAPELRLSQSFPCISSEPMDGVQSSFLSGQELDTHDDTFKATGESNKRRRFSLNSASASNLIVPQFHPPHKADQSHSQPSFPTSPFTTFSFNISSVSTPSGSNPLSHPHKCEYCGIIVCSTCKADFLARYEARQAEEEAKQAAAQAQSPSEQTTDAANSHMNENNNIETTMAGSTVATQEDNEETNLAPAEMETLQSDITKVESNTPQGELEEDYELLGLASFLTDFSTSQGMIST